MFLFRDAAASNNEDKVKPISDAPLFPFWYQLLLTLENSLVAQSNTLDNGERLKFVVDYPRGYEKKVVRPLLYFLCTVCACRSLPLM